MSARWGDKVPQVRDAGDGTDAGYVFGKRISGLAGLPSVQGVTSDRGVVTRWADVPQCAYAPAERVKAMDADGIGPRRARAPRAARAARRLTRPRAGAVSQRSTYSAGSIARVHAQ